MLFLSKSQKTACVGPGFLLGLACISVGYAVTNKISI